MASLLHWSIHKHENHKMCISSLCAKAMTKQFSPENGSSQNRAQNADRVELNQSKANWAKGHSGNIHRMDFPLQEIWKTCEAKSGKKAVEIQFY